MPASPVTRTNCGSREATVFANNPLRTPSSTSRPTKGLAKTRRRSIARAGDRRLDPPGPQGLGLALRGERRHRLTVEGAARELVRELADDDAHRRRVLLQARRRVDGVADDEALAGAGHDVEAHERGARVDADPRLDVPVGDQRRERREPVQQAEAGPHRAFGVVLVQLGHAEHAGHGVSDVLLDDAAVGLDRGPGEQAVLAQETVDVLRVEPLGEAREADQVGEQHGDDAPLGGERAARVQRSAARTGRTSSRRGTRSRTPGRRSCPESPLLESPALRPMVLLAKDPLIIGGAGRSRVEVTFVPAARTPSALARRRGNAGSATPRWVW